MVNISPLLSSIFAYMTLLRSYFEQDITIMQLLINIESKALKKEHSSC